ncbi:MAG: hypothetical protein Q9219_001234 [cf. Caloplaca sp. 3 TL-2023]
MPAKPARGPRKGKAGKKLQIDKMIENAKKAQPTPAIPKPPVVKPGNGQQKKVDHIKIPPPQKPQIAPKNTNASPLSLIKGISSRTVVVRLPYQELAPSQYTKKPILYTKPAPLLPSTPQVFKNPNRVVVRLPLKRAAKPTSFLDLPNEIRNIIYGIAMPRRTYGIQFIKRQGKFLKRPTELTYHLPLSLTGYSPDLTAADGERRRYFDLPTRLHIDKALPRYSLSSGPTALLLVSKKVNEEITPMFYGRNTFSFQAMRPLKTFLGNLRPQTRTMIRSLEIFHYTAGNPQFTADEAWKDTYDRCWHDLCFQIRDQCTGLDSLNLDLTINDLPFIDGPLANWMGPLYAFMNLDHLKKLNIQLHQSTVEDAVLEVEAYRVRQELMGPNFYEAVTPPLRRGNAQQQPKAKVRPAFNSLRITSGTYTSTMEKFSKVPVHLLPRRLPLLDDPRATVFWHPPSPVDSQPQSQPIPKPKRPQRSAKGKGKTKA